MLRKYAKKAYKQLRKSKYRPLNKIELSREAMLSNFSYIQNQHSGFKIIPVLKGNAYGHGIEKVAEILNDTNCGFLAVDGYFEAQMIRDITRHRILVMGHIFPENAHLLDTKRCSFVIQDTDGLHAFGKLGKKVNVHLELNTGMNRLGLRPSEVTEYLQVLRTYPNLRLEGVMTHLADADNETDNSFNKSQLAMFDEQVAHIISEGFEPDIIHIAQTAGSVKIKSKYANAIRLGIGLYGINPLQARDGYYATLNNLKPVLELKSTIIKVIDLSEGDKVSYNCTFTAPNKMRVGVLALGYYEGVPRELSNKGFVTSGSSCLPIVGRVCMDHTIIDLQDTKLQANDEVTVISRSSECKNTVAALQDNFGLFSYSTLTGLSNSIRREII